MTLRIGILEPDGFSRPARVRLAELGAVADFSGGELGGFLADKDVLFVRLAHRIDVEFLRRASKLRVLCSPTTGHTHIELDTLTQRGIRLLSLKGEGAFLDRIRATPEHTIGLMLALLRNYRTAFVDERNDHWDRDRCRGEELCGMAVGFIGFGRIGRRVASYLAAFGANVGYYDPRVNETPPSIRRYETMSALIAASRLVVLAASLESDRPIVDRAAIDALDGRYLVNIARGELLDEEALLAAVEGGRLAGCAVDVIRNENGPNNRDRWIAATRSRNVIVTPHIGGATYASMRATEEFIADKLAELVAAESAPMRSSQ